jgi:hypothetical protein
VDDSLVAQAAQDDEVATFDVTMPTLPVWLNDEIQHIEGLQSDATDLRPGGSRILNRAKSQIFETLFTVNTYWPPATED